MTLEQLRELADRADEVEGRPATRVREVRARIAARGRRRQLGAVVAVVLAVVLAISATSVALSVSRTHQSEPVRQPRSDPRPTPQGPEVPAPAPAGRQLVWAKGSVLHVGDRSIDVGGRVWNAQTTDDGAVFTRAARGDCFRYAAGCNEVWFTDGEEILHIGTVYGSIIRGFMFDGSTGGSTVVWFEPSPADHPHGSGYELTGEYVVYDTHARREVARMGSGGRDPDRDGHAHLQIEAVFDDYVYWTPDDRGAEWCADYSRYYGACRRPRAVMRLATASGSQTKVAWSTYADDRRRRARMFVQQDERPDAPNDPFPLATPGHQSIDFLRDGDRLVADDGGGGPAVVRVAGTGRRVQLRLPRGYGGVEAFFMVTWLDDTRVVLRADNVDDLLVCRLPDGRCRTAVRGPLVAGFGSYG